MEEKVINHSKINSFDLGNLNLYKLRNLLKINRGTSSIKSVSKLITKHKLIVITIVIATLLVIAATRNQNISQVSSNITNQNSENASSVVINKEYRFPIYSSDGKTESSLKMVVTSAVRNDKIVVNGKSSQAAEGKDFLVLNMEITNSTNNKLNVRPVDFFRLVGQEGQLFAADVYNDPVKVEPISIKKTRVAYVVFESQENFKFQIGEIKGEKQEVEINI